MNFGYRKTVLSLLALGLPLALTACSNSEDLAQKVRTLESENATLKTEIAIMKETYASAKTAELKAALSGAGLADNKSFTPSSSSAQNLKGDSALGSAQTANGALANSAAPASAASGGDSAASATQESTKSFSDLDETPTKDMISDLAKLHIFDQLGANFEPNKEITRAEYAEWLFKAYNALEPESKQIRFAPQEKQLFKDTPATIPQYKYIQALANAGFSIGYDDGTFRPTKPMTREEMLGIKVGVDVGKTLPPWRSQMDTVWKFSDGKNVDERFTGYVHQDFYVSGKHGSNIQRAFGKIGSFKPKQNVLRYEAAATLWQMGQFGETQTTNVAAVLQSQKHI